MKTLSIHIPILTLIALVISGGAFYGGMAFAKASVKSATSSGGQFARAQGNMVRLGAGGNARAGGAVTSGEVVSKTDNGFSVKLRDGGSKVVLVASSTTIGKMTEGSMADLSDGTEVVVMGTANSDGSVTASTVQIRPEGSAMIFGGPQGVPQADGQRE